MGKRFRNSGCAYCGAPGFTADHIFARAFFPVSERADLPQVSACEPCNHIKSELEHYLASVLPFGALHPQAADLFVRETPKRLAKNRKLHVQLASDRQDVVVRRGDAVRNSLAIPIQAEKLTALYSMIARGLATYCWGVLIPSGYAVGASFLTPSAERMFEKVMLGRRRAEVRGNLGDGLFLYQGIQAVDDPSCTLWRFQIYGGITFAGDETSPGQGVSNLWASTSRRPIPGLSAPASD
jgi:hypothetical protein